VIKLYDKTTVKNNLFILFLLICFFSTNIVSGQKSISVDSVYTILRTLPDTAHLSFLKEIAIYDQIDEEILDLYQEEALRLNDDLYLEDALFRKGFYYYPDSLDIISLVLEEARPLFYKSKNYTRLFLMEMWYLRTLTRTGKTQEALGHMHELRDLSAELGFPRALEMIDQELAYFYMSNNMIEDARNLYYDVLRRMRERNAPLAQQLPVYVNLFPCISDQKEKTQLIQQAYKIISQLKDEGVAYLENGNPLYQYEIEIEWHYSTVLTLESDPATALDHIKKYEKLLDTYQLERHLPNLYQLYMNYYSAVEDDENMLKYLELVEGFCREKNVVFSLYTYLDIKAEVLEKLHRYKDALAVKDEMIALKDTLNQESYNESLANMRTRHEVDKLQLENDRMEMEARQTRSRMMLLGIGCILLVGVVFGLVYIVNVVNRSKKVLQTAKDKAEEADQMKSAFLANMNHEIRTPLNSIVGFSQVLVDEEDKENRATFAEIIGHNNELLQRLIGDVLDISKIESNSMSLVYSRQDIPVLMKEIYNMISLRIPENVVLLLDSCEPLRMETDKNRLVQIVTNLLTNAAKHTSIGHIRFGYNITEEDVVFYVEDTGEGIPESQLKSIFDRFTQLENSRKGVGLGLAISKGLVENMGGRIWVESIYGEGSTFYFTIPLNSNQ